MFDYDVIVVGGGISGLTSAQRCANHGLSVLVLEALYTGGRLIKTEENIDYPGFEEGITGEDLTDKIEQSAKGAGVRILHERVEDMQLDGLRKEVKTDKGRYSSSVVIIAIGARRRELGLEEERVLKGMGFFHSAKDEGSFVEGKRVVLAGNGNHALKEVLTLADYCEKIYFVCPDESLSGSKKYIDKIKGNKKIEVILSSLVAGVKESVFCLEEVTLINGVTTELDTIKAEAVFVAQMPEPDTDILWGKVKMNEDGAVRVDSFMKTDRDGVFAAGAVREGSAYTVYDAIADAVRAADSANEYIVLR